MHISEDITVHTLGGPPCIYMFHARVAKSLSKWRISFEIRLRAFVAITRVERCIRRTKVSVFEQVVVCSRGWHSTMVTRSSKRANRRPEGAEDRFEGLYTRYVSRNLKLYRRAPRWQSDLATKWLDTKYKLAANSPKRWIPSRALASSLLLPPAGRNFISERSNDHGITPAN